MIHLIFILLFSDNLIQENRKKLKYNIERFLGGCTDNRIRRFKFWDSLKKFCGKLKQTSDYGVTNLDHLFKVFSDVILCQEDFIILLKDQPSVQAQWGSGVQVNNVKGKKNKNSILFYFKNDWVDNLCVLFIYIISELVGAYTFTNLSHPLAIKRKTLLPDCLNRDI